MCWREEHEDLKRMGTDEKVLELPVQFREYNKKPLNYTLQSVNCMAYDLYLNKAVI